MLLTASPSEIKSWKFRHRANDYRTDRDPNGPAALVIWPWNIGAETSWAQKDLLSIVTLQQCLMLGYSNHLGGVEPLHHPGWGRHVHTLRFLHPSEHQVLRLILAAYWLICDTRCERLPMAQTLGIEICRQREKWQAQWCSEKLGSHWLRIDLDDGQEPELLQWRLITSKALIASKGS